MVDLNFGIESLMPNFGTSTSCPVCGDGSSRQLIATIIVVSLRTSGNFSVGSVQSFWKTYKSTLCSSCGYKLKSIDDNKRQAMSLLEEAVRLDSSNSSARKNLSALKNIL